MDFIVMNEEFKPHYILDTYESMLWTIRFIESGDFELYTTYRQELLENLIPDYYIYCEQFYDHEKDEAYLMIIETITIENKDGTAKIKVTGRDLKSILERRIVWGQVGYNDTAGTSTSSINTLNGLLNNMLTSNIINPTTWTFTYQDNDPGGTGGNITIENHPILRKISNFAYDTSEASTSYLLVTLNDAYQYNGETIYDVVNALLKEYGYGYKVVYNFTTEKITLKILDMEDHTYSQTDNTVIIFSTELDNIKESNYLESSTNMRNTVLVKGEDVAGNAMYNLIEPTVIGLKRREIYIDASSEVKMKLDKPDPSTGIDRYGNKSYEQMLLNKATKDLKKDYAYLKAYDGVVVDNVGYTFLEDYDVGYICEMLNEYGIETKIVISEVVMSISNNGITIIPTFSSLEEVEN